MTTLNSRILDLALAGHEPGEIAVLMGVTAAQVEAAVQDLTNVATPTSSTPPAAGALTVVSGTAQQDATLLPSMVYVAITGHAAGTVAVAIGPTSACADAIIPTSDASLNHVEDFKLPAGWFFKVTVGGSAAIASALQVNG